MPLTFTVVVVANVLILFVIILFYLVVL